MYNKNRLYTFFQMDFSCNSYEGVSKFRYILFSYPSVKNAYNETKPRLSQAKALPYHKNFVSL